MPRQLSPNEAKSMALRRWKRPIDELERQRRSFEASERARARWAKERAQQEEQ